MFRTFFRAFVQMGLIVSVSFANEEQALSSNSPLKPLTISSVEVPGFGSVSVEEGSFLLNLDKETNEKTSDTFIDLREVFPQIESGCQLTWDSAENQLMCQDSKKTSIYLDLDDGEWYFAGVTFN